MAVASPMAIIITISTLILILILPSLSLFVLSMLLARP